MQTSTHTPKSCEDLLKLGRPPDLALYQACPEGQIAVVSNACPEYLLYLQAHCQLRGLRGLVVFDGCLERLRDYLALICAGRTRYFGPELKSPLSESERTVLHGVGLGQSNKEIARELEKSDQTVKHQLSSVMRKLGLGSRAELRLYYLGKLETPGLKQDV